MILGVLFYLNFTVQTIVANTVCCFLWGKLNTTVIIIKHLYVCTLLWFNWQSVKLLFQNVAGTGGSVTSTDVTPQSQVYITTRWVYFIV